MNATATVDLTVRDLPATGGRLANPFTVKAFKTTRGREGGGYTFTLLLNGEVVGDVENWGDGGGSWIRGNVRADLQAVLDAAITASPAQPSPWADKIPADASLEDALWYAPLEVESADHYLSIIGEEVAAARTLDRQAKTALLFLRDGETPEDGAYNRLSKSTVADLTIPAVRALVGETSRVWHGGTWTPVTALPTA